MKRREETKRAAEAAEQMRREFLILRFMVGESMARLESLLSRPRCSLRAIHRAAAEVHSDAGGLYGTAFTLSELQDWRRRSRAGKRRRFGGYRWPDAGAVVRATGPKRRRFAEGTLRHHLAEEAKDRAWRAGQRANARRSK